MAEFRCRSCGASFSAEEGQALTVCPSCGAPVEQEKQGGEPRTRINFDALFTRAKMALADGEFARADGFCEQILNEDPTCAEAYLYKLLAELRLPSREALSGYRGFYDKNNNYKRAFRFGDEALRAELLAPMNATAITLKAERTEADYLRAKGMLAGAKHPDVCYAAEKIFLALGEYRDAPALAASCRETAPRLAEERKKKKAHALKLVKRISIGTVSALAALIALVIVLTVTALCVYLFGFRLAKPNSMCDKAISLTEEGKYEEALELLAEAKKQALFSPTKDKIDDATERTLTAQREYREQLAAEAARREEIALAVEAAEAVFEEGKFRTGISTLIGKNIPVLLFYDAEDAKVTQEGELVARPVQYRSGDKVALAVAERENYSFVKWELGTHTYDEATQSYFLTLCAVFDANQYKITYSGGGTADNPKGYSVTTSTFTLAVPVREGYTFLGWTGTDLDERTVEVTVETGSTGDRRYTAHWQANTYRVTLDAAGGELEVRELDVVFGSSFWLTSPKRNGYALMGWKMADGTDFPTSNIWNIAEDVTLTAEWIKIDYVINYSLGGVPANNFNPIVYDVETGGITLKDLSYPNCTFLGWYSDAARTHRVTSIPAGSWGAKTLYAKWHIPTFDVILDLNGGYGISQQVITYSALDLPLSTADLLPQKDLHTFYYWAKDELDGVPVDTISACSDVLLVANYLPEYTQVRIVTDADTGDSVCQARYWVTGGSVATPSELCFPKYHRINNFKQSPYIQVVYLATPTGFDSISFSEEVLKIEGNLEDSSFDCTEYDGGSYVGSRGNPYFMLFGNAVGSMPQSIHPETRQIYSFVNQTLTRLTIPQNVQKIHKDAFSSCHISYVRNLSPAIKIVAGSTDNGSVARNAAIVYNAPTSRNPDGYFTSGDFCFYTEASGDYVLVAFMGGGLVTEVDLPETVKGVSSYKLGAYAFMGYKNIECVKFPAGVTEIGNGAFYGCTSLVTIEHAAPFTAIGTNAFEGCVALTVKPTAP